MVDDLHGDGGALLCFYVAKVPDMTDVVARPTVTALEWNIIVIYNLYVSDNTLSYEPLNCFCSAALFCFNFNYF